jgi:acetyl esterase
MANLQKYPVHPDYAKMPSAPFPFNGIVTGLINLWIEFDAQRRMKKVKARIAKHWVPSADRHYFPVYEFRPHNSNPEEKLPAVVYYHGGAFVLTYASSHVVNVAEYANRLNCSVFVVDYRLAPKHIFPKGFEDCYAALEWVHDRADWLHVDPERIAVMGDSAGGCFSAGVAQKAFDEKRIPLRGQCLIYPALDNSCSTFSATNFTDAPIFNGVANKKMWEVYLPSPFTGNSGSNVPAYAAPANRKDLTGLAPAFVETGEFDPLRDEGEAYAKRLKEAGVPVTEHYPKGTIHGYDMIAPNALAEEAIQKRSEFLKSVFA